MRVKTVRDDEINEDLRALISAGCGMLTTVAWEMARLTATPLLETASAGAVSAIEDSPYERLRTAAAAQVAALSVAPPMLPELRSRMAERATLAIPLHQAAAILLRDRQIPYAYGSQTLSRRVCEPLRTVTARTQREAPSANHAQAVLDGHQSTFMASVRRLAARSPAALAHRADPALIAAAEQDFVGLAHELVEQQEVIRTTWLPHSAPQFWEASAVLELLRGSSFDDALNAFARIGIGILRDLLGPSDGPRRRWLGAVGSLEALAESEEFATDGEVLADEPTLRMSGPQRIGRYEIEREIARGGMATVFSARDTRLDRNVALKVIVTGTGPTGDVRLRFAREVRLCARLNHPNIVPVYDAGDDGGRSWLAMRLVTGPSLATVLTAGPLTVDRASARFLELTGAIAHVHGRGIVHRDIKPSNILIEYVGAASERAVLADFGIAQTADEWATRSGDIVGTPGWIAPEVAAGRQAGAPADIWALARVYVAMLTGDFSGVARLDDLERLLGPSHARWIRHALHDAPARRPGLLRPTDHVVE